MEFPARPWQRAILAPPGLLYRGAVALRNLWYRRGWRKPLRAGVPVVSVGNLTAGGSGKTPFVLYLAARVRDSGGRVAVAARGYGGRRQEIPLPVSEGNGLRWGVEDAGDEPVLLATYLPSVPVVVCRDRVAAARFARERYGSDLVILDDGFQHRRLHRDLDLLLIDAGMGLGNGKMLPLGPLREPAAEIRRAHALVLTGREEDLPAGAARMRDLAAAIGLDIPVFRCERRLEGFLRADSEELLPASSLRGFRALAFSGIARPGAFESDLHSLGVKVVRALRFPDHQAYGSSLLDRIRAVAGVEKVDLLVTTEKDRVRLGAARFPTPLYALRIRLLPQDEATLWSFFRERLPGLPALLPTMSE